MCGITGVYSLSMTAQAREAAVSAMNAAQTHRGPDGSHWASVGAVTLGHNHLKIMDLSEDSNQPFLFEHLSMVFNGEVYNYLELRRELQQLGYSFETSSDTEVILKSYHCWGEASVARFVGMWALAIWDDRKNQLFCSRDRFGIKPFVYQKQPDGTFSFASEIKALKKSPGFAKKLNVDQANLGLGLGWVGCGTETYYQGIESLSPAHNLVLDRGGLRIVPYWTLDPHSKRQQSPLELQREFAALFNQSLEIHLRSQVEVGACLSGGIDSSAIVSSICGHHPDRILKVFHIYYSDYVDERPFAQYVLNKYPNTEAHYYSPDANDLSDYFAGASAAADSPVNGSSFVSHYALMDLVKKTGLRVLIDGQGADEYLGGYLHSFYPHFVDQLRGGQWGALLKTFNGHRSKQGFGLTESLMVAAKSAMVLGGTQKIHQVKGRQVLGHVLPDRSDSISLSLAPYSSNYLDTFLYNLMATTSLPTILHHNDRNSMAFGIESRVPFLDHRLVEFAFTTPNESKISLQGETKSILRQSMQGIIPDEIMQRYDKKGFVTPGEIAWLKGPLKDLLHTSFDQLDWLDSKKMARLMRDYHGGDLRQAKLVWKLCSLNYWLKNDF